MNARRTILLAVLAVVAACIVFVVFQQAQESSEVADAIDSTVQDATAALSSGDPSAALRMLSKAISEHPDEPQLHLLTARAYCARGRYKDALDALSKADGLELEPAQIDESKFIAGRAVAGRYLETGAPEDRKLSQADLQPLIAHSRFGGAAKVLLGRVLTRKPTAADASARREAIDLLESGLADPAAREWLHDIDDAQQHLAALKAADAPAGG